MARVEETLVQALSSSLTEQQTQIHTTPPGFDKAIRSLPEADRVSSAFQAAGIWAWISYFLVASHDDEIKQSLSQLPGPTLEYVISEVSKVKADPSLVARIRRTLYHSHRAATRRRLLTASGIELPEQLSSSASEPLFLSPDPNVLSSPPDSTRRSPSLEPNPTKRLRLEPSQEDIDSDTVGDFLPCFMGTDASPRDGVSDIALRRCDEICELPPFCPTPGIEAAYPKARYIPLIFPHALCKATHKRGDDEASLMLSLPTDPGSSRLVFDMCASDVIHFARELFGVRIGVENKRRVLVIEDGMIVELSCGLKLIESSPIIWARIFGQKVNDAMAHSQKRQDEIKVGELVLSRCLSMEIPIPEKSPARLCLVMQPENLSAIFRQLWQD